MTKHRILTILLIAFALQTTAQQLPNSGFEDWNGAAFDGNIQPAAWNYSNVTQFGFKFNFAHRETGHSGSYCALVKNQSVGAAGISEVSPGYFALGQPWVYIESLTKVNQATAGTYGGISFTYRPDSMYVWIKRTGTNTDKENYNIVFYSWIGTAVGTSYKGKNGNCTSVSHTDEESDIRQATDGNECTTSSYATQVAEGWIKEKVTYNDWVQIKVPIYYNSNSTPNKCNVIFSASNYPNFRSSSGFYENNALYVDDVELIYSANIDELYVNNRKWSDFDPSKNHGEEQIYALGLGTTNLPSIFAKRGVGSITNCRGTTVNFAGRVLSGNEISINTAGASVDGAPVTITVTSEDGHKTSTYKIKFVAEQSSNSRLAGMSYTVNGVTTPIPNFSGYITSYSVELPYGTTAAPMINTNNILKGDASQTINITQADAPNGTATVVVTAANGSTCTYVIHFSVGQLTDNTLSNIFIGNTPLAGFSPTKTSYTVALPLGTTTLPIITPVSAYDDGMQTITTTNNVNLSGNNCTGTYNIAVSVPGNPTTRTYKLSFRITASTYSYLNDLKINGRTIDGWDAENIFTYYYNMPIGTTALPAITWTTGDPYQTVTADNSGIIGTNGTYKLTVTAASGAQSIYKIVFNTAQSSISTLNAIYIDNTLLPGFDAHIFNYTYMLPLGTTTLPNITYTKGDIHQSDPTILSHGVNGTTRIVVQAQDGSTSTYTITFSVQQANNTALRALTIEGYNIDYTPMQLEYNVTLTRGTTTIPNITYEPSDAYQHITRKDGGVNGDTRIMVKTQTGATATYIIHFTVAVSNDASLQDIKTNGISIEGFDADTSVYNILLPTGTVALPTITYVKGDYAQSVQIFKGDINDATTIVVTAEDGTQRTYTLNFSVEKSANAYLKQIYVNGDSLPNFNQEKFNYIYLIDTTVIHTTPIITVDQNEGQYITIVKPQLLGTAIIRVTPETGLSNTYTITFCTRATSSNNLLNNILLNGTGLTGFDPDTLNYNITLPAGTTIMPTIGYVKGDHTQTVLVSNNGLNAKSYINVRAEDASVTTYTITVTQMKSSDATLRSIKLDGVHIAGFNSQTFAYTNTLPAGATHAPRMTFEGNTAKQSYVVSEPLLTGTAQIIVTAEDGITRRTYTVTHVMAKHANADLQGISIDGTPIKNFSPTTYNYTVAHHSGPTTPVVTVMADSAQTVVIANAGINGTQIVVTAENGTQHIYNINYTVIPSDNALLQDLQIYNGSEFISIAGFLPMQHEYADTLPWHTTIVPAIRPIPSDKAQTIIIDYGSIDDTTHIYVTAGDGVHTTDYAVMFTAKKSAQTALNNLQIEDAELTPDFNADTLNYVAHLPYGTTIVPSFHWEYGKEDQIPTNQRIILEDNGLNDTTILTVMAENGDSRTYRIRFEVAKSNIANTLLYYIVDGVGMFSTRDTVVTLPYGATTMPKITCMKSYKEQIVHIDNGGLYTPTTITVKANRIGVPDAIYTLRPKIAEKQATMDSIIVNGIPIADFKSDKYQYVVPLHHANGEQPRVRLVYNKATTMVDNIETTPKRITIPVIGKEDNSTASYTLYFHYTADTLPNSEFKNWSPAAVYTSVSKPTGWNVLADVIGDTKIHGNSTLGKLITKGIYKPGQEVTQIGDQVRLHTTQLQDFANMLWQIAGVLPGFMTLGDITAVVNDGSSSTSVMGGIVFRNTPDTVRMSYRPIAKSHVNSMHFVYTLNNKYVKEFTDANFDGTWKIMTLPLTDNTVESPTMMNITINNCETENAAMLNNRATSEMMVDWVHFSYNSKIAKIFVNGIEAMGFRGKYDGGLIQSTHIDAETVGAPTLTFAGEVNDQEYTYSYGEEEDNCSVGYKTRVVNITSKAEDGTLSRYVLNLNRPFSTVATLAGIVINGDTLKEFMPNTFHYTIEVAKGAQHPDIMALHGSAHQSVRIATGIVADTIVVTAENGDMRSYVLHITERQAADVTLATINMAGIPTEFEYNADTTTYTIRLSAEAALPEISYTKQSDGQRVTLKVGRTTTLTVTAENGVDSRTYTIRFVQAAPTTSGQLADMNVVGVPALIGFKPNTYSYRYATNAAVGTVFARADATDTVRQIITTDTVRWQVQGSDSNHTYTLIFDRTPSNQVDLANIVVNDVPIAGFNAALTEYSINIKKPVTITALQGDPYQHIAATFINDSSKTLPQALFTVTAEDGITQKTTTVYLDHTLSANALLEAIIVNDDTLNITATEYIADKAFAPNVFNYNLSMHCDNPKLWEPTMPNIIIVPADATQKIVSEINGMNASSYITVTAEDGTENLYTLDINAEQSSNADLSGLAVDYKAVDGFDPDIQHYTVQLSHNGIPEVSYTMPDKFRRRIDMSVTTDSAVITVVAENGTTKRYTIAFTRPIASHNALLQQIEINNLPLPNFSPTGMFYSVHLPAGTATLPSIMAILSENGQSVSINSHNGLRDTTDLIVTAPDGYTQQIYHVYFDVALSTNAHLRMIYLNGDSLTMGHTTFVTNRNFNTDTLSYDITLPVGTRILPAVTVTKDHYRQTIAVDTIMHNTYVSIINVIVTAEQGNTRVYRLNFTTAQSDIDTLQNIYLTINGIDEPLVLAGTHYTSDNAFSNHILHYNLTWQVGTRDTVSVNYEAGSPWQTVEIVRQFTSLSDSAIVRVIAENGTQRIFVLHSTLLLSNIDTLRNIFFNGLPYTRFHADTLVYDSVMPYGTTLLPTITWEVGDAYQRVTLDSVFNAINGHYTLTVTAENGTRRIYTFRFSMAKSNNALLKDILVNGTSLNGFIDDRTDYVVTLPYGTTAVPSVTWEPGDSAQTIMIKHANTIADTVTLIVTAEDGITLMTYRIHFRVALSDNALLNNIFIGGEPLDSMATGFTTDANFAADLYEYHIMLPYGTQSLPTITWQAQLPDSVYTSITLVNDSNTVHGTSLITIVSQDGMKTNEYYLHFNVALSSNNKLQNLYFEDIAYPPFTPTFNPDTTNYVLSYPQGTVTADFPKLSNIRYVKGDADQTVAITYVTAQQPVVLTDTTITLTHEGTLLRHTTDSVVIDTLAVGTTITVVPGDTLHTIIDTEDTSIILISVTAQNGMLNLYTLRFVIAKSNNSKLKSILIDGIPLDKFDANLYDYTYVILKGAAIPLIEGIASDTTQTIEYGENPDDNYHKFIYCTAEDGSESIYSIKFQESDQNPGNMPTAADVCWTPIGGGAFKAGTNRNNVSVTIYDMAGHPVAYHDLPLTNPNDDICDVSAAGFIFHLRKEGKVLIYVFYYNHKKIVTSGKFLY